MITGEILRVHLASRLHHHTPPENELWVYYHSDEFGVMAFIVEEIDYAKSHLGYWVCNSNHTGILIPYGSIIFVLKKEL